MLSFVVGVICITKFPPLAAVCGSLFVLILLWMSLFQGYVDGERNPALSAASKNSKEADVVCNDQTRHHVVILTDDDVFSYMAEALFAHDKMTFEIVNKIDQTDLLADKVDSCQCIIIDSKEPASLSPAFLNAMAAYGVPGYVLLDEDQSATSNIDISIQFIKKPFSIPAMTDRIAGHVV